MVMKGKSELLAKYGDRLRKAFDKHKNDETDVGNFGGLPEGIEGGVAQLVECKFDKVRAGKDNAGEWYFTARGVVKSPLTHNGHRVYGLQTSIIEPLYDTPTRARKTVDEHLAHILNQMRLLGADTADMGIEDLEETAAALKEAAPHFQFRTWKGGKQTEGKYKDREPRVQEMWGALVEWNEDDEGGGEAVSGPAVEGAPVGPGGKAVVSNGATGTAADTAPRRPATGAADTTLARGPSSKAGARTAAPPPPPADEDVAGGEEPSGGPEFGDLDSLAEAAGAGDEAAEDQLTALALKAGLTQEFVEEADSWQTVVQAILEASGPPDEEGEGDSESEESGDADEDTGDEEGDGGEEAAVEVRPEPKVKQAVRFRPPDKKAGGKPSRRAVECTITAVYRSKRLADLKSLDDPTKVYKNVSWDALED
jgi:hypothetical protein